MDLDKSFPEMHPLTITEENRPRNTMQVIAWKPINQSEYIYTSVPESPPDQIWPQSANKHSIDCAVTVDQTEHSNPRRCARNLPVIKLDLSWAEIHLLTKSDQNRPINIKVVVRNPLDGGTDGKNLVLMANALFVW